MNYTNIEQSKRLLELGINSKTADATLAFNQNIKKVVTRPYNKFIKFFDDEVPSFLHPCWSLDALIKFFPCGKDKPTFNLTRGGWDTTNEPKFVTNWFASIEQEGDDYEYIVCDSEEPVDAVVNLIIKLKKEKGFEL